MQEITLRIARARHRWWAVAEICRRIFDITTSGIVVMNFTDLHSDLRSWHCICARIWTRTDLVLISFARLFLLWSTTSQNNDATNSNKQTSCDQNGNHRYKNECKHRSKHFNNSICCSAKMFALTNRLYIPYMTCILLHAFLHILINAHFIK